MPTATMSEEVLIEGPKLVPFKPMPECDCPSCGQHVSRILRFLRWIRGAGDLVGVDSTWCEGGKAPTERRPPIEMAMTGASDRVNECAGVMTPHLHIRCCRCGLRWLMATRP